MNIGEKIGFQEFKNLTNSKNSLEFKEIRLSIYYYKNIIKI